MYSTRDFTIKAIHGVNEANERFSYNTESDLESLASLCLFQLISRTEYEAQACGVDACTDEQQQSMKLDDRHSRLS